MSTQTVSIPLGDVDAEIEIEIEESDVESVVERWLENNHDCGDDSSDVSEHVENILREYTRQQENGRQTCDVGRAFEKAVEYAALKAFKKLLGG